MPACPIVLSDEYWPHFQHSSLHGAEIPLDFLQPHVAVVNRLRGELIFRDIGDDDITTGQVQDTLLRVRIDGRNNLPAVQFQLNDTIRSEEHTSELQSQSNLVCRLLLEKKKKKNK